MERAKCVYWHTIVYRGAEASVCFSLTFQCDNTAIVYSIQSILTAIKTLKSLPEKESKEWPSLQLVQNRTDDQGVPVAPSFDTVLSECKIDALTDLQPLGYPPEQIWGRQL